ncbi:Frag1/DRAM/Sfk1 family-domain-containing protein [Ampelomyces quisqualis]|uniref:Frag1/DRAM/Sfk1 family-domain-containing protein n=1 Tax=Ampelomyces quisqualis TaxID=50730 RepID=A0A6A5QJC2_AMPQU|nr:Frag1/DRAM/Sfk1 family-domain-containing protein [Ampelomyces quisqualis]
MLGVSYWIVPIFSSTVWIACLVTMLAYWAATGRPHYVTMSEGQWLPYISDIGADTLKPMFIAMSTITVVTFDLAFIFERYLRHAHKLTPNTSIWQKVYSACATLAAIVGAAGLILLTIFDCKNHNRLHNIFLAVFIIGYIVSAIFICWEYQRLGIHYREHSILRRSFWVKLAFIGLEICLCVAFGVCSKKHIWNVAAGLEWSIAFIYCLYVLSFFVDFLPAIRTKSAQSQETEMQVAEEGGIGYGAAHTPQYFRGDVPAGHGYANGHGNGYANGHSHGYVNGYANGNGYVGQDVNGYPKPVTPPAASRNF